MGSTLANDPRIEQYLENTNIVVSSSALPTGSSTSALQTSGNSLLTDIKANQTNGTQTVALPSGASTEAKQDTGNTSLSAINTKVATSAKQDTQITAMANSEISRDDLAVLFRTLLYAIRDPVWLDIISNSLKTTLLAGSTTAVTGSLTSAGTVSTVATVTSVTNQVSAGGFPLDMATVNLANTDWALTQRNLMI